jgi:hypothetical protein
MIPPQLRGPYVGDTHEPTALRAALLAISSETHRAGTGWSSRVLGFDRVGVAGWLSQVFQPLTAPVSPPTTRRSNKLKNTSAGIIDNEVNASTFAVSTEYCDAKASTTRAG